MSRVQWQQKREDATFRLIGADSQIATHRASEFTRRAKSNAKPTLPAFQDRLRAVIAVECPFHLPRRHALSLVDKLNPNELLVRSKPHRHLPVRRGILEIVAEKVPQDLQSHRLVCQR